MTCPGCGSTDHTHNTRRHEAAGVPVPPCAVSDAPAWLAWIETDDGRRFVEAQRAQKAAAIAAAGELEGADLVAALRSIGARRANVLEAIVARAAEVLERLELENAGRRPLYPDGAPCGKCFQVYAHAANCEPSGGHHGA